MLIITRLISKGKHEGVKYDIKNTKCREGSKNVDLLECVWTYMTLRLKQVDTVMDQYTWKPG